MRKILMLLIILLLVACQQEEKNERKTEETAEPTPVTAGYAGPFIGGASGEESEGCTANGGCSGAASELVDFVQDSLPLSTQTVEGFTLGIPEGYSPLVVADEIILTAVDAETLGGFTVVMRKIEAADLATILEKYEQPDFSTGKPIENETLTGHSLPNSNLGTIALLESAEGQKVFVEGFASPGYWPAFTVTFDALLETLELTP